MTEIIESLVVRGNQLGSTIGFPTANLSITQRLDLANGVYPALIYIDDNQYHGIANLGCKPTIEGDNPLTLEVHIFDFKADIYGQRIKVKLLAKLRDEQKFESLEQLKKQIESDVKQVKQNFKNNIYVY